MAIGTATQIIKKDVSNNIFNNIIDITDPKGIWEKLQAIYSQIRQDIIDFILQELLNYPQINKLKGFEKPIINIFTDV